MHSAWETGPFLLHKNESLFCNICYNIDMVANDIILSTDSAYTIIAFLLSLLPAGLFIWLWYLRRHDRPVPIGGVVIALVAGGALVWPAFKLESYAASIWYSRFPSTAHYFTGAVLPLQSMKDIILPAFATFGIVATVEEGLRYIFLRIWFSRSKIVDQVFDGMVLGIATGIGFATLENTLYFLNLLSQGHVETLVFVFILRFLISTLAHIIFSGLMGAMLARAVFHIYKKQKSGAFTLAFFISWFIHGLYDLLLGLNQAVYSVLILLPPLLILVAWFGRREFFAIARDDGKVLVNQKPPITESEKIMNDLLKYKDSPWNKNAPWLREKTDRYKLLRDLEDSK